jgi:hypothetical protein
MASVDSLSHFSTRLKTNASIRSAINFQPLQPKERRLLSCLGETKQGGWKPRVLAAFHKQEIASDAILNNAV